MIKNHDFPPVMQILLAEPLKFDRPVDMKKWWREIAPELRRQANWTVENYSYPDAIAQKKTTDFLLRVSGGIDPFSTTEICDEMSCRVGAAEQFARTVGLFADQIVIPDIFTTKCLHLQKTSGSDALSLTKELIILHRLRPLLEAGVIRFGQGDSHYCKIHHAAANEQIKQAAVQIVADVKGELRFSRRGDYIHVFTGSLYEPEMIWVSPIPPRYRKKRTREIGLASFRRTMERHLGATMRDLRSAERLAGVLASNSRIGMLAVKSLESRAPEIKSVNKWESARSVSLPWVENLAPIDVVRLRDEASHALPRLRAVLAEKLSTPADSEDRVAGIVNEVRNEAAEVEAELNALNIGGERKFRTLSGSLGVAIAIYGVAAGPLSMAAGLGTLISLLGLIHAAERNDKRQHDLLTSRPGYVLIKAKEIAGHRALKN